MFFLESVPRKYEPPSSCFFFFLSFDGKFWVLCFKPDIIREIDLLLDLLIIKQGYEKILGYGMLFFDAAGDWWE